jgi:hypothetical protein
MKTFLLLMLTAALLIGCETTSNNHAYWQARSNAIADLPAEQQAAARIEMLRDWQAAKEVQQGQRQAAALAVAQGLQQAGAEMQENARIRQQQSWDAMQHCIDNLNNNPALQYHPVPAPTPVRWDNNFSRLSGYSY